jgi:hypothetical protein
MKPISLGELIQVGRSERFLFDVRKGWSIRGSAFLTGNIDLLLSNLDSLKFRVTLAAADELRRIRSEFEAYPPGTKVSEKDEKRLREIMRNLRNTLRAEARTLQAYLLTEKRLEVGKLLVQPQSFLGEGTFRKLPEIAQFDIREAGKCIAFEVPTAAAFHLLRATEDALRAYYRVFFKHGPNDKDTWGMLVQKLQNKKRKPRADNTLLNHLDHIRKNFRNPTDHPEMIYDIDGSQDLFSVVADVLNRMAKELPEVKSGTQGGGLLPPDLLDFLPPMPAPPSEDIAKE